ncbi:hypothetical protein [Flavobacterium salmonis]|uniref:Uncharacterized protein n=1 Tax=Flavobacterium salmonis TaxID=2654844 RepID=A0A6V6YVK9_9FLAO|nr:hypothetical protein [Flavobacterium salmonis]CAD0003324.1 hypothetical protein FLAT13_01615 [Flavobacterium salmonis]
MKVQNPVLKSLFCATAATLTFFIIVSSVSESFNQTMGIIIGVPITFIGTFVYCFLLIFLEQVKVIAPNFVCRFSVPFSFCCIASVFYCILNDIEIVDHFHQFSFTAYWLELSTPFLVFFITHITIAGVFSVK